jgi:hypothetical protein
VPKIKFREIQKFNKIFFKIFVVILMNLKLKKKFSKTFAVSLAILSLFSNNFNLVKSTDKNNTNKKTSLMHQKNGYKKIQVEIKKASSNNGAKKCSNTNRKNKTRNKNIIKCFGLGTVMFLAIWLGIKRYSKHNKDIFLKKNLLEKEIQQKKFRFLKEKEAQREERKRLEEIEKDLLQIEAERFKTIKKVQQEKTRILKEKEAQRKEINRLEEKKFLQIEAKRLNEKNLLQKEAKRLKTVEETQYLKFQSLEKEIKQYCESFFVTSDKFQLKLETVKQWFKDFYKQDLLMLKSKTCYYLFSIEEQQNFIKFFLKTIYLIKQLSEIILEGLNFENYEKSREIIIKNTGVIINFDYHCSSKYPLDKCKATHETVEKALENLAQFFSFFAIIIKKLTLVFPIEYYYNRNKRFKFENDKSVPNFSIDLESNEGKISTYYQAVGKINVTEVFNFENVFKEIYEKNILKELNYLKKRFSNVLIDKLPMNSSEICNYILYIANYRFNFS